MNRPLALTAGLLALLTMLAGAIYWEYFLGQESKASSSTSLEKGIGLFDQRKYPEALAELKPLADGGTENWRVHYYLGSTYLMLRDFDAAAVSLERALALKPDEAGTLYALGVAYYQQGNLKLANAYFGAVLEINPNDQHARGLMDIMNRLEKNSVNATKDADASAGEGSESGS